MSYRWSQDQYYVGTRDGMVAVYQGVPGDVGPLTLHHLDTKTDIAVSDLPGQDGNVEYFLWLKMPMSDPVPRIGEDLDLSVADALSRLAPSGSDHQPNEVQ